MPKKIGDNRLRVNKTLTLDQRIFLSAEKNGVHPSRFIEEMFERSLRNNIPDEMPLVEKQAAYVELDQKLRALGVVIAQEQEAAKTAAQTAAKEAEQEAKRVLEAQRAASDEAAWNDFFMRFSLAQRKEMLEEASKANIPFSESRQWLMKKYGSS